MIKQQNDDLRKQVADLEQQNAKDCGFFATNSRELNMTLDEMAMTLDIKEIREQTTNLALIRHEIQQYFNSTNKLDPITSLESIRDILDE